MNQFSSNTFRSNTTDLQTKNNNSFRYVPIGDSYTIGNGLEVNQRWPNILVQNLQNENISITLIDNPSVSGWTTAMAREGQISVLKDTKANVTSVLLGANDAFQGYSVEEFRTEYKLILDEIEELIPAKKILLVTLPDYSNSPASKPYGETGSETRKIEMFNAVITREGIDRGLPVADIFPLSQQLASNPAMFVNDGLHPSAMQVEQWEKIIRPEMEKLLK